MRTSISHVVLSVLFFALGKCTISDIASPCPRFFVYENNTEVEDRWYGAITLLSDYDLTGVWLRIVFDKPVEVVKSTFGEVTPREDNEYLIKDRNFKLFGSVPHTVRFYVQYKISETPATFVGFRLNGRIVCPELDLGLTTTERLFTSWKTEGVLDNFEDLHGNSTEEALHVSANSSSLPMFISTLILQNNTVNTINSTKVADNSRNEISTEEGTLYVSN